MTKNQSNQKYLLVLAIIGIAIIGFGVYYLLSNSPFPKVTAPPTSTPAPTPTPIADVTLSPSNQIVVLSLYQQPSFSLTVTQNGHGNVAFPCSVTMVSSLPDVYDSTSTKEYWFLTNYGTQNNGVVAWVPVAPKAEAVSYYAVVQDSNGIKITSNTVTVEYK